jgi:outer membrane autotransporter protein
MKSNVKTERRDGQNLWRQSVLSLLGLLLLTLLAANPLTGLGQGVISGNSTNGVDLNATFGPAVHSVTVNSGVTIDNSFANDDAIHGYASPWHLINNGTLNGKYEGVKFDKGGSVNNTAAINGGYDGIDIAGDAGSVVNSGFILGTNYNGIFLEKGGSVNNLSGGTIWGTGSYQAGGAGVYIQDGLGSVNNAGTIEALNGMDGVYMNQGGSVTNSGGIYGSGNGVNIVGGTGSVVNNSGSYIIGYSADGVYMDQTGSVSNNGYIFGDYNGASINGPGYVVNNGTIVGGWTQIVSSDKNLLTDGSDESYAGVNLNDGGVVINNGTIYGAYNHGTSDGVVVNGGLGFVTNSGTIFGYGDDGVELNDGGVVNNLAGGSIGGDINGVDINGPAIVINHGGINGNGDAGVYLNQGGFVYNGSIGSISGHFNGVEVYGAPGSVVNRGSIIGANRDGIYMDLGGTVVNKRQGIIEGGANGVEITGAYSFVTNSGTITGISNAGVRLEQGGTVINQTEWHHQNNSGMDSQTASITDSQTASVYSGNTIPTITGGDYGVQISGDVGTVINSGTIIGTNNAGVRLEQGGTVVNQTSQHHRNNSGNDDATASEFNGNNIPTIEGGIVGVNILGGLGFVTNSGSISGGTGAGVWLHEGGIVVNQASQRHGNYSRNDSQTASSYNENTIPSIAGGDFGVLITGSTNAVVINSGVITGTNNAGVRLEQGGTVVNQASRHHGNDYETASAYNGNNIPTISGGNNGVVIVGGTGYVSNDGNISAVPTITPVSSSPVVSSAGSIIQAPSPLVGNGVIMGSGGTVVNGRHGTIEGYNNGVVILGSTGYVYNHGDISVAPVITPDSSGPVVSSAGTQALVGGNGVYLGLGGTVDNDRHGTIGGNFNGVEIIGNPGYVSNDGDISGGSSVVTVASATPALVSGNGVYMGDGGTVENNRRGSIEGYNGYGVEISGGPGVVVNSGYIYGGNGTAISLAAVPTEGFSNSVTLGSRSTTIGNIVGGGGTDAAFLQGHGQYDFGFTNFATLDVQAWGCRGWNLTGTNFFSTSATVEYGTLRINGELDTPQLIVSNNATLGGSGVINGTVDIQGILSPGNSPGIVTINGSLNFADNSAYNVDAWRDTNDLTMVLGGATIGTNVPVNVALNTGEIYRSTNIYTILTATNGVSGQFDRVDLSTFSLFLTATLEYPDTNNVDLVLHRSKFTTVAQTYNQNAVAGALDGILDSPAPGMTNLVSEMFWMPSGAAARAALDSLSGEIHGTLGMLDVQQQDAFNNSIALRTGRMSAGGANGTSASATKTIQVASTGSTTMPPMQQADTNLWEIWLQGFGSFGDLKNDGNAIGGDYTISGMSGGLDYHLTPELLLGLALGYSQNNADVGGPGANGKVDAFQIGGYGGYVKGPWHLDGIFSYGFLQTDTKRQINVGDIHQEADGKYNGGVFSVSAEGGYAFAFDWLTVEPTIGINYSHLSQDSFNETGAAGDGNNYGLHVNNVTMDSVRSVLGVRLAAQFGKKDGVQFIPALRAGWEHEFADRYADLNARFVGGSGDFTVRGVELGADSGVLGAGLTVAFNKAIQGFVNYDASLNSQLNSQAISGGLSLSW